MAGASAHWRVVVDAETLSAQALVGAFARRSQGAEFGFTQAFDALGSVQAIAAECTALAARTHPAQAFVRRNTGISESGVSRILRVPGGPLIGSRFHMFASATNCCDVSVVHYLGSRMLW